MMRQAAANRMSKERFEHLLSQEVIVVGGYSFWNKFKKLSLCLIDRKWVVWHDGEIVQSYHEEVDTLGKFARELALEKYNDL